MESKSGFLHEVRDNLGRLRCYILYLGGTEFKFDKKGLKYFIEVFDDGNCFDSEGYLAKRDGDKIIYFHREFKFANNFGVNKLVFIVHHKNHKKNDNRNCNLIFTTEDEHKRYHDDVVQIKIEKARAKYEARGERMQERYKKRGERIRERYEKRGARMRARFSKW